MSRVDYTNGATTISLAGEDAPEIIREHYSAWLAGEKKAMSRGADSWVCA